MEKVNLRPALILSQLATKTHKSEPHAFIILNNQKWNYPIRHILFDVENLTIVELNDKQYNLVGLYSLTDEQFNNLINGSECSPTSIHEIAFGYREISDKRTYGNSNINQDKSL